MDEELEQSDENQDPVNEKPGQSNGNQDRLIEIYKLQAQLADNISNRRISIHKFYLLLMSGLVLIFPAFFKLPTEVWKQVSVEFLMIGIGVLGIFLCVSWFILISSNLRLIMLKYEALKKLENKLEYKFFKKEWKFLGKYGRGKTYWEISYIEMFIPILFFLIFTLLLNGVSVNSPDKFYFRLLTYCPTIIGGVFGGYGLSSWQIDRSIRGLERWTDKKICWIAVAIAVVYGVFIFLFRSGYRDAVIKEAETINKKPAETTSEKPTETRSEQTTTEKVILPDGNEQDGSQ